MIKDKWKRGIQNLAEAKDLLSDSISLLELTKGHKAVYVHFGCHM